MTHDAHLRSKARELRIERRMTIDEIAERLALSRSTIYHWVRDLPPAPRRSNPGQRLGSLAVQRKYRLLREAAYARGRAEFDDLAADPTFRDFVCMYIGEGYKRNRNRVALANSDPNVVQLANRWIRALGTNRVYASIQYHADQDLHELRSFWGALLEVDPAAIRFQRKSNSSQLKARTWRSKYGVVTVASDDTMLRARLQGWIDRLQESWLESAAGA